MRSATFACMWQSRCTRSETPALLALTVWGKHATIPVSVWGKYATMLEHL